MTHLICFGLGYCAREAAKRLVHDGWRVSGTATTAAGAARLNDMGYAGLIFDGTEPAQTAAAVLTGATHVLVSIPPARDGDPALIHHGRDIAASRSIEWIGYYSTIGVYGDAQGGWVDEETPPRPGSERGQRRIEAENGWLALGEKTGKRVSILRLPGIYGPGRSAFDDLRAGTARRLIKPGQVFNRAHVADIATATIAAFAQRSSARAYNVVDDEPAPPQDVIAYAASLLGVPCPPDIDFATATLSPMAQSFYSESKRVSNKRMKSELHVKLAFATYRDGLAKILRDER